MAELKNLVYFAIGNGDGTIIVDMITTQSEEEATDKLINAYESGEHFVGFSNCGINFKIQAHNNNPEIILRILELTEFIKDTVHDRQSLISFAFLMEDIYGSFFLQDELEDENLVEEMRTHFDPSIREAYKEDVESIAKDYVQYGSLDIHSRYIDWDEVGQQWLDLDLYNEEIRLVEGIEWDDRFPLDPYELVDELPTEDIGDEVRRFAEEYENSLDEIDSEADNFIADLRRMAETLDYYELDPGGAFEEMMHEFYRDMGEMFESVPLTEQHFDYEEFLRDITEDESGDLLGLKSLVIKDSNLMRNYHNTEDHHSVIGPEGTVFLDEEIIWIFTNQD